MTTFSSEAASYPASAIQEQFWLLNQLHPESPAYNIPLLFRIRGSLDRDSLEKSLNDMLGRHQILRTRFAMDRGDLVQRVAPSLTLPLACDVPEGEEEVNRCVREELRRPFSLSELPLIRFRLFRTGESEHLFLIVMHHIITDLRTKELFTEELSALYGAAVSQRPALQPPSTVPYAEFSRWQRDWLAGDECRSMLLYWKEHLKGRTDFLDLPMEKKRPELVSLEGEAVFFHLEPSFVGELKQLSRDRSVTIFLTLLAAYAALLFRYGGNPQLTIGVPLTNRRKARYKDTLGCFVNILPLAVTVSGETSFPELLGEVRQAMLGAHRHQEAPYRLLAHTVEPRKEVNHNPLFQAGFTLDPPVGMRLEGLDVEPLAVHSGGAQLDLFFTFWEGDDGIRGYFEYNSELFDEAMVRQVSENYRTLLREILRDGDRPISSIPVVSEREKETLCVEWNQTEAPASRGTVIHRLIEAQVDAGPHAVAAVYEGASLTYGELNRQANQLARYLGARGVKPGDLVGVHLERSLDMLVALVGVMKSGAAYVPLDPAFPRERLQYMLSHTEAPVVLTQESLKDDLSSCTARQVFMDTDRGAMAGQSAENPDIAVSPEDLAYVIYTSGSTGRPKGVAVHHDAVVNFLSSMAKRPGLTAEDVVLAVTTLSFDITVLELYLPLIVGARVVIAPREAVADGRLLLEALARHGVTLLQATPVTWRLLIAAGWQGGDDLNVLCGGEAMSSDLATALTDRSSRVWNMYGPTETTVWSTCSRVTAGEAKVSVGRPIDNTRIYILDSGMQPVPTGVSGTLFIGGAGVARGYLHQPELTGEMFVPDPFAKDPEARMYNTGDLARYRADGTIEVLGRADFQLKINGFRIEAEEVETALATHPVVSQAIVSVYEFEPGDARLVAYLTHTNGGQTLASDLRKHLARNLPDYMIPSIFMPIASLPLTPNGKVDRKGLPVPETRRPQTTQAFTAPQNDLEKLLSEIWGQVLKVDTIGTGDSFFELGGNSLLGVRVVGRVGEALKRKVPVVALFQYPTIAAFAQYLSGDSAQPAVAQTKITDRASQKKRAIARRRRSP
ncbi:non-ribosomal peptide synthetase [Desulfoluna spongiiphila]|uniref:Amino acid adenylation domain-containing protein n=1 Tax=Desulfoluna spongiiphila TaxID=419481 RepID=A0A1G5C3M7_9BACT|nr:non-ribosomal peptide synthetase [Desulfoluna spongiiphila]SCX96904.1 amino acid adenylation domain-containing protein [Desulfoluna spongiiphila]